MVLDVRFLPNPYFVEALSALTGRDEAVAQLRARTTDGGAGVPANASRTCCRSTLPRFEREGKAYVTIAIGCTGGRHRSVAVVEELARSAVDRADRITVRHRDIGSREQQP